MSVIETQIEPGRPEGGAPPAPVRPDGLPDQYWDDKAGVKYADLVPQLNAYADLQKSYLAKPEDIDWSLSKDIDLDNPDTVWELNRSDPMLGAISKVFVEHKATQPMVSAIANAYASEQVAQYKRAKEVLLGEQKKLGDKWQERHDAARAHIARAVGEQRAAAYAQSWVTAEQVEVIEALAKLAAGPGGVTVTPPTDGERSGRSFYDGMKSGNS